MTTFIARTCVAVAASAVLGALGATGANAAGAATRTPQPARSMAAAHPLAVSGARLWVARYNWSRQRHSQ
jgi:hypothetical protein